MERFGLFLTCEMNEVGFAVFRLPAGDVASYGDWGHVDTLSVFLDSISLLSFDKLLRSAVTEALLNGSIIAHASI